MQPEPPTALTMQSRGNVEDMDPRTGSGEDGIDLMNYHLTERAPDSKFR